VVFLDSTKYFESTAIESRADLPLDLDTDAPWMIEHKWNVWEWIVTSLDEAIDQAENGNPTLCKFISFCPHEDNPNIGHSDKHQQLLDTLKLPDIKEKEKSKPPTLPSNPNGSSMNNKKPAVVISPIDIDRLQY
jgi:hypothetical protein